MSNRNQREIEVGELAENHDQGCREFGEHVKETLNDSPIEAAFAQGLHQVFEAYGGGVIVANSDPMTFGEVLEQSSIGASVPFAVYVFRQVKIEGYRVDFLLTHRKGGDVFPRAVVVECDGHEFHERTKEQAESDKRRDRDLQSKALPVFRVTGTEIWRSPVKTAFDVYVSALNAMGVRS